MHPPSLVADLAIVLGVAALTGLIAQKLRQPSVLGYLLAGLLVGPYLPVPLFADVERVESLAELGVILVMFAVGLELRLGTLIKVVPTSGITALVEISALFWAGHTVGWALGWSPLEQLFLGACVCISSTMVVSRIFAFHPPRPDTRAHVLGVLVLQDVAAIALIAAMTGVAASGQVAAGEVGRTLARLAGVLLGLLIVGLLVVPRLVRRVGRTAGREALVIIVIGLCFSIAAFAHELGFSVALGAFLAGILVAESGEGTRVEHLIEPVRDLFAAIFFVSIGMTVDPLAAWAELPLALLITVVVIAAQLISVTISGLLSGIGLRRALTAGIALGQIGEFAFIIAAIGTSTGVVRPALTPVIVTVAVLTAFTSPLALRSAPALVGLVDRLLPNRVRQLIGLYENWLEHIRAAPLEKGSPLRRVLRLIALDALAFIALLALALVWLPSLAEVAADRVGLAVATVRVVLVGLLLVFLTPVVAIGVRNTLKLSHLVSQALVSTSGGAGSQLAARTFRGVVHVAVLIVVGMPAAALLRPLVPGPYVGPVVGVLVLSAALFLWRQSRALADEYRSGAEHIARMVTRDTKPDGGDAGAEGLGDASLIPGLDKVVGLRVLPEWYAVGRSLAELNVRARTGTTVVAIRRGEPGAGPILPTGVERIEADDVLAVTGTQDALAVAIALLREGWEAEEAHEPAAAVDAPPEQTETES